MFQKGTITNSEYVVEHVNIVSNPDYRIPGRLTERENALFTSLQEFLNNLHKGRLVITDEMIDKAKKLYRKQKNESSTTVENEYSKTKSQATGLNEIEVADVMSFGQDDLIDNLDFGIEIEFSETDTLANKVCNTNGPVDVNGILDEYEKQKWEADMKLEADRERKKWLLQERLRKKLRNANVSNAEEIVNDQLISTETAIIEENLKVIIFGNFKKVLGYTKMIFFSKNVLKTNTTFENALL